MFNDELTLISYTVENDKIGNPIKNKTERTILADVRSCTRNEFYNYGDAERRPEYIVTINDCEYQNEVDAVFKGDPYNVLRTYKNGRDLIELTLVRDFKRNE